MWFSTSLAVALNLVNTRTMHKTGLWENQNSIGEIFKLQWAQMVTFLAKSFFKMGACTRTCVQCGRKSLFNSKVPPVRNGISGYHFPEDMVLVGDVHVAGHSPALLCNWDFRTKNEVFCTNKGGCVCCSFLWVAAGCKATTFGVSSQGVFFMTKETEPLCQLSEVLPGKAGGGGTIPNC